MGYNALFSDRVEPQLGKNTGYALQFRSTRTFFVGNVLEEHTALKFRVEKIWQNISSRRILVSTRLHGVRHQTAVGLISSLRHDNIKCLPYLFCFIITGCAKLSSRSTVNTCHSRIYCYSQNYLLIQ
jgi:hypothetical protein